VWSADKNHGFRKKERIKMKKTIALGVIVAVAGLAQADSLKLDVSGVASWDFQGDSDNVTLLVNVGAGANITSISWDVNLTTVAPSWAEENTMGFFGNSVIVNVGLGDAFTVSNANYQGSVNTNITLGGDGILDIEFYEVSFDDIANGIDSFFKDNSSVVISGTGFNVPAPSALALLGLGGLVAGRRRR